MRLAIPGQLVLPPTESFFARAKKKAIKTKETIVFKSQRTKAKVVSVRRKTIPPHRKKYFQSFATFFYFLFFFALSITLFLGVLRGVPGNPTASEIHQDLEVKTMPFELSPERGRYVIVMALDENRSFNLTEELRDVAYPDVGYYEGRYYSFFAPGISLLSYPLYVIGKQFNLAQVATFSTISIFAVLNMLFIYKISRRIFQIPMWAGLFASATFAFASTSLSYANTLYQHHVTTFFILSSFFAVWKFSQGKYPVLWASIVWLNYALAIWIDYPNAILFFPVMVYLLLETVRFIKKRKRLTVSIRLNSVTTVIVFFLLIGLHGYYNYVNFDSPTRVSGSIVGYKAIKEFNLLKDEKGLEKLKQFESMKQPIGFFEEENFPKGVFTLLVASDKGIFFFTPIFLLALLDLFYIIPRLNRVYAILLSTIGVNLFLYASFGDPWGGWAYGPRYLIPSMAILSIFLGEWLFRTRYQILMKISAFALFLFSSGIAIMGAITTNAVPPKVEAIPLKSAYNYLLSISLLQKNQSSSYFYNTFYSTHPLVDYFFLLYVLAVLLAFSTLFLVPMFRSYDD